MTDQNKKANPNYDDTLFTSIPLAKIKPDEPLPADVFLKIHNKHIKFKEKNDTIPSEKFDALISKNLQFIYVAQEDSSQFLHWIEAVRAKRIAELVEILGVEYQEEVEAVEEIKERVYETFLAEELNQELVEKLQNNVTDFVSSVSEKETTIDFLTLLRMENPSIADHSVNVANLSVYLAMVLGHDHQSVLENIYMGALFHDYGKAKIPRDILENRKSNIYSQAINDHPLKGAERIRNLYSIPMPVLTIIEQHHEQFNGKGFPRGLANKQIYELAQIVSIANTFDNQATINARHYGDQTMYKLALKFLEYDRGKHFDPQLIQRLTTSLRLALKC
ncbi:MAG: HD domain-containing protein [Oligoflexia bacterium]|nr:HD domain-containing protein [Oligoflexia bacterium]MBF0365398.1 HD domain-containing protein [Oligoflexia bacterium]